MRGLPSLPRRLARMERQQTNRHLEAEIARLAAEFGLPPDEVRREAEAVARHRARYGPEPIQVTITRLAAEFGLDVDELRAEYERIMTRSGSSPCRA